jgi:hypothetical protein
VVTIGREVATIAHEVAMIGHELVLGRDPATGRRPGAAYAESLDAWLGGDAQPAEPGGGSVVSRQVDWGARQQVAALAYDTSSEGLPSGVRAVVQEGCRRLMFEADRYEVLVQVRSGRLIGRHELFGQVMFRGLPLAGAAVRLDADRPRTMVVSDQTGSFRLPPLAGGVYGLHIAVDGAVLVVPPIAVG